MLIAGLLLRWFVRWVGGFGLVFDSCLFDYCVWLIVLWLTLCIHFTLCWLCWVCLWVVG